MSYSPITMTQFSEKATPGAKSGCGYEGNFFQPKQNKQNLTIQTSIKSNLHLYFVYQK